MRERPTHIDLFSGIGGFALAAQWAGFRTVAFCEIDAYCQAVLKARFGAVMADAKERGRNGSSIGESRNSKSARASVQAGRFSGSPVLHSDIRILDGTRFRGAALLTGGFPCQPFSVAGKRAGAADDRFLWPEMLRVIAEARPAWVLGENVAGIVQMELDHVLSDLEGLGYSVWPLVIPACAVDAKHRRDRVWIVAHSRGGGRESGGAGWGREVGAGARHEPCESRQDTESLANGSEPGLEKRQEQPARKEQSAIERSGDDLPDPDSEPSRRLTESRQECCLWEPEPNVGRVANGIPRRVDRIKGLGNAIVPQVAYEILSVIYSLITGYEQTTAYSRLPR